MVEKEVREPFPQVIGQQRPKLILWRALKRKRLAHSYLFYGGWGVGKDALALELAKAVNCQREKRPCGTCQSCTWVAQNSHPDLIFLYPLPGKLSPEEAGRLVQKRVQNPYSEEEIEGSISIDAIRAMEKWSAQRPFMGKRRVVIISHCDRLTTAAANALLKSLEEPPPYLIFLLTTAHPHTLPPTIRSRCQPIRFGKLSPSEIERTLKKRFSLSSSQIKLLSRLAGGSLGKALQLHQEGWQKLRGEALSLLEEALWGEPLGVINSIERRFKGKERTKANEVLEVLFSWYRDLLLLSQGREGLVTNEDQIERLRKESGRVSLTKIEESLARLREAQTAIRFNANLKLGLLITLLGLRRIVRDEGDISDRFQGLEEGLLP